MQEAHLIAGVFAPVQWLTRFEDAAEGAGGIVSFTGKVRGHAKSGDEVRALLLEAHPRLTLPSLQAIGSDAACRFDISHWLILHRHGHMVPGDPIVCVAAASHHRRAAFEAADYMMDRLKTEAYFWKKEICASGSTWIEPRAEDYHDQERWHNARD